MNTTDTRAIVARSCRLLGRPLLVQELWHEPGGSPDEHDIGGGHPRFGVDDHDGGTGRPGDIDETGSRIHGSAGAHYEQSVGSLHRGDGIAPDPVREWLAEPYDGRSKQPAAPRAVAEPGWIGEIDPLLKPASGMASIEVDPSMQVQDVRRPGLLKQAIHVLGDVGDIDTPGERPMGIVG